MRIKGLDVVKRLAFPERCPGCRKVMDMDKKGFCPGCLRSLRIISEPVCECCGKSIESYDAQYCFDCGRVSHSFIQNRSLYEYEGSATRAMYNLKYNNDKWIAGYLAGELFDRYERWLDISGIEALIPVPMYYRKEKNRGYNQAEVIARHLAEYISERKAVPVVHAVKRVRNTIPQKELSVSLRRKNVKKAFKLDKNVVELNGICAGGSLTVFRSVLVVDDIYTTGATIDAVSDLCLAGGIAQEVYSMTAVTGRGNT